MAVVVMGPTQREGKAREQLKTARYRVRRWTAFIWDAEGSRTDREDHLDRIAAIIERRMLVLFPRMEPKCARVRIEGFPQLLFELTVDATDEGDARKRAIYRCERALSAKVQQGFGRKVRLTPPWGRVEIGEAEDRRRHAIG